MQRINTVDGKFVEGNPAQGIKGTRVTKSWADSQQEEPATVVEMAGIALDAGRTDQLYQAILKIAGIAATAIRVVAASGPVLVTDRIIVIDATAGNVALTLLSAAHADAKAIKIVRKRTDTGANTARLLPAGGQTIAGETEISLMAGEGYEYIPDGATDYLQF